MESKVIFTFPTIYIDRAVLPLNAWLVARLPVVQLATAARWLDTWACLHHRCAVTRCSPMFKSKLFEVHHNLFPQYEYAYTKWWKWYDTMCSYRVSLLQQSRNHLQHSSTGNMVMLHTLQVQVLYQHSFRSICGPR